MKNPRTVWQAHPQNRRDLLGGAMQIPFKIRIDTAPARDSRRTLHAVGKLKFKIEPADPGTEDMALTVLDLFEVERPDWMEDRPVLNVA